MAIFWLAQTQALFFVTFCVLIEFKTSVNLAPIFFGESLQALCRLNACRYPNIWCLVEP